MSMSLYEANNLARWFMSDYVKRKEEKYNELMPGAEFRFPAPSFYLENLRQCVQLIEKLEGRFLDDQNDDEGTEEYIQGLLKIAELIALARGMKEDWHRDYIVSNVSRIRYVVASACRYGDLITAVGARHFSPAMCNQLDAIREEKLINLDNQGKAEQGFIDQFDVFMTREEAFEVAVASGQLNLRRMKSTQDSKRLHSEDLW